jgi:wobble nucleotide-excising tRNase
MLKKIIAVRSVGRFINSGYSGVPAYLKTTLVLGGNAFGKTTLCSVLRSLATNDPAIIVGRARLGATTPPEIEILLEAGKASYHDGAWNVSAPEFLIFDGTFIAENVHAGDVVDLEQRRNLYRVIVGKEGVGLAAEEEHLAGESRGKSSEINTAEKAIKTHVPAGMKIEDFISLPADADIDAKIAAQAKTIEAVRSAEQLKARAGLTPIHLPDLPANLEAILGKTLDGIAKDAQKSIAEHLAHHGMKEHGEGWLEQGTEHIADGNCPYCGQSLKGLPLIRAYQKVFADSYRQLKTSVGEARTAIERDFGDREIVAKKAAVAAGDLRKEEAVLVRLNAQKKRYDPSVAPLCAEHRRLVKEKEALDKQKADVRTKLEAHTAKVIKPYEGRINQLLDNFNAGFTIAQTKPAYSGGVASSTYQIVINNMGVALGDGKTRSDQPSFKNTISGGDRSALALAVFVAHLERDKNRANRVVVFDDPFMSQDSFRRRQTVHEIVRVGETCKQLIVFSHDASFLRQIRDKCEASECVALQLADHRSLGIKIMPCDLDEACRGRAASDMDDLQAYVTTGAGKERDIIRKMRIVLETHCRYTFSGLFETDDRLGGMVEKIKKTGEGHPGWGLVDELELINEYSRDHHHGEDPTDGGADLIDAQELTGFVKRTLRIVNNLQA